jgi:hypothetical protein
MRTVAIALLLLTTGIASCRPRPSDAECAEMLDRYVEMTLGQAPSLAGLPEDRAGDAREARRAEKRQDQAYTRALAQCRHEISRRQYECAMTAPTPNDWEACVD